MLQRNSTTIADSEIKYDRLTRDYAVTVAGQLIGYAASYSAAEQVRTAALAERRGASLIPPGTEEDDYSDVGE